MPNASLVERMSGNSGAQPRRLPTRWRVATYRERLLSSEAVSKPKYVEGDVIPRNSCNLEVNSPVLYATAKIRLPGMQGETIIVLDYPVLTMRRLPRASEVDQLVAELHKVAGGKVNYDLQPIEATNAMTPEQAAQTILAADFTALTVALQTDFLRRMR